MDIEKENSIDLRALARQALADMILNGKLSGGDLIKLLGAEEAAGEGSTPPRDFVIRLVED